MDKSSNNDLEKQMRNIQIDKDVLRGAGKVVKMQNEGTSPNFVRVSKTEHGNVTYTPQQRPVRKTYNKQITEEEIAKIEAELKSEAESLKRTQARLETLKRQQAAKQRSQERHKQYVAEQKQAKKDAKLIEKIEKDYEKKQSKTARYTTSKSKMNKAKEFVKRNSQKIKITAIAAIATGALTLGAYEYYNNFVKQNTISTSNVAVMANDNEKLEKADVEKTDALELIELTNNVNEMIEDGSYKNLTQEQLNELADETRDVTADILKGKAVAFYNQDKEENEKIENKNIVIGVPNDDDGITIPVYQTQYYGFPNVIGENRTNLMIYSPSSFGHDAYLDYANLCLAMDDNTVTFEKITDLVKSTNKASSQTLKEHGFVNKTVTLDDSVVTRKERQNYEEVHRAEDNDKDESSIKPETETASTKNMIETSILSSEDIDLDDEER